MSYRELVDRIAALTEREAKACLMLMLSSHAAEVAEVLDRLTAAP